MTPALTHQIISYQNHIQTGNIKQAKELLDTIIESFPHDQVYKIFALSDETYKASLLYHRIHQVARYWQGENLKDKTIALYCQLGFEYSLLFLRYLPLVHAQNPREIQLLVKPQYYEFFSRNLPDLYTVVAQSENSKKQRSQYDYHCDLFSDRKSVV